LCLRWYGVAYSPIADLGVGTVTASALRLAGLGGSLIWLGACLHYAGCSLEFTPKARASKPRVLKANGSSALDV
jgi:hypothetical protein